MSYLKQVIFVAAVTMVVQGAWAADQRNADGARNGVNGVVARVNGKQIKQAYADAMMKDQALPGKLGDPAAKRAVLERLVTNELFVQEAMKRGLDKDPEVVVKAEMLRRDLLANVFIQAYMKEHPIGDEAIREEYERVKATLAGAKEYSVRHILVADESAAREIIDQLRKGASFERLVEERSLDEGGSKNYGGSLGWISVASAEKPLVDAVATLAKGGYTTQPVQSRFGWHVLRLDDVRDVRLLSFEAARDRLRQQLQQRQLEQLEHDLRAKATVAWTEKR